MYYLYIKTHNETGLKYLGKTNSKDPFKYKGSGKYWRNHLNKHGFNVSTTILLATEDQNVLKETGIFFSKIFNIVKSKEWANLTEESGNGGWEYFNKNMSPEQRKAINLKLSSPENVRKRKENLPPNHFKNARAIGNAKLQEMLKDPSYKKNWLEKHKLGLPQKHQSGTTNSQFGKKFKFVNDKIKNYKIPLEKLEEYLEQGYILGRIEK